MVITFNAKVVRAREPIVSKDGKFKLFYFVVVNRKRFYSKKAKETVDKSSFINCLCIKKADINLKKFQQLLTKGQMVNILSNEYPELGQPYTSEKTGETYSTAILVVKNLNFIGKLASNNLEQQLPDVSMSSTNTQQPDPLVETSDNTADDLPF